MVGFCFSAIANYNTEKGKPSLNAVAWKNLGVCKYCFNLLNLWIVSYQVYVFGLRYDNGGGI